MTLRPMNAAALTALLLLTLTGCAGAAPPARPLVGIQGPPVPMRELPEPGEVAPRRVH